MNKTKNINKINLLNYQHFLKNNSLKKQKIKLKNILFDNPIIYKRDNLNIIEINNSKNISIPLTILNFNQINTIKFLYENQIIFNYNLTNLKANILYNFNKIVLNYMLRKTDIIKGKMVQICKTKKNENLNKKLIIAVLGMYFPIKSENLNKKLKFLFFNKKKLFFKDYNKNKFLKNKDKKHHKKKKEPLYKKADRKIARFIRTYQCNDLNFKVKKLKHKYIFSRVAYVNYVIKIKKKQKKIKKQIISGKIPKQLKMDLFNALFVEPVILKKKD